MSNLTECVDLLLGKIGIDTSTTDLDGDIVTLRVGSFFYHIKEHNEENLTIYTLIPHAGAINQNTLLDILSENHFSKGLLSPVFSYDKDANKLLLWNQQPIRSINAEELLDQLEAMISTSEATSTLLSDRSNTELSLPKAPENGIRC